MKTKNNIQPTVVGPEARGEIILYHPDETIRLEVRMEDETVWLSQAQMAELFQRDQSVIARHISNIYKEEELTKEGTYAKFAYMGHDGLQKYEVVHYNLDVIISVGYRVKSKRGTQFRQWASKILKDYLLHGYSFNYQLLRLQENVKTHDNLLQQIQQSLAQHQEKIDFFVRTSLPPVQGIFFDGQIFDAYRFVSDLVRKAKTAIVLIVNYIDDTVLTLLDKRGSGVTATIYTSHVGQQLQLDLGRHNAQYAPITVNSFNRAHDRFLLIDNEVYHIGASLKDLGKKWFAFTLMKDISADDILNKMN